jgi:mono/diheme cytochrome c family protein
MKVPALLCRRLPLLLIFFVGLPPAFAAEPANTVDYLRDVKPILARYCFACHGPDEHAREANLRLDRRDGLLARIDDRSIVVPGHPESSELVRRILSTADDVRMPPASADKSLTPEQQQILERWVAEGAKWQEHWSFVAPVKAAPPTVRQAEWPAGEPNVFCLRPPPKDTCWRGGWRST